MTRLIAFGCSMTYGAALPDCWPQPAPPSKFAWPELIATAMSRECVNKSSPGASNKRIWHNIINFEFQETDLVFILWSMPDRASIVKSKEEVLDIGPWMTDQSTIAKHYYSNIHHNYNSKLETALYINHSNLILNQQNVQVYNLILEKQDATCFKLSNMLTDHIPLYIGDYERRYPRALDNAHIGIEGTTAFAKDILKFLNIDRHVELPSYRPLTLLQRLFRRTN